MAHPAAHAAPTLPAETGAKPGAGGHGHAHDHASHDHGQGAAAPVTTPHAPAGPSLLMAGAATRLGGVLGLLGLLWLAVAWALGDPS